MNRFVFVWSMAPAIIGCAANVDRSAPPSEVALSASPVSNANVSPPPDSAPAETASSASASPPADTEPAETASGVAVAGPTSSGEVHAKPAPSLAPTRQPRLYPPLPEPWPDGLVGKTEEQVRARIDGMRRVPASTLMGRVWIVRIDMCDRAEIVRITFDNSRVVSVDTSYQVTGGECN